jgi:hypothetical protein
MNKFILGNPNTIIGRIPIDGKGILTIKQQ